MRISKLRFKSRVGESNIKTSGAAPVKVSAPLMRGDSSMNAKEVIKNNILIGMGTYLDSVTLQILGAVTAKALFGFEITTMDQLPATIDNTNEYVIDLYRLKNSGKLSEKTISYYLNTVREFIDFSHKPLTVADENDVENYLYHKRQRGDG
jgi:integrase/recombinase XerD